MLKALNKGDEVITGGGIVGRISKISSEDMLTVEIAKGVEVTVLKSTVSGLTSALRLPANAPKKSEKKEAGKKNDNTEVDRERVANDN